MLVVNTLFGIATQGTELFLRGRFFYFIDFPFGNI